MYAGPLRPLFKLVPRPRTRRKLLGDVIGERGVAASFPHGHGVGLDSPGLSHLSARINGGRISDECVDEAADLPLEAGMVRQSAGHGLCAEGNASLHMEQSYIVETDGNRPLVEQDRTQPVVP